jgi:hypothetical protein
MHAHLKGLLHSSTGIAIEFTGRTGHLRTNASHAAHLAMPGHLGAVRNEQATTSWPSNRCCPASKMINDHRLNGSAGPDFDIANGEHHLDLATSENDRIRVVE